MRCFPGYTPVLLLVANLALVLGDKGRRPNIILFMGDDIGNADYQRVDPAMRTPNLLALEKRGLVLNQSYTLQTCTPTRSALLTGRYSYRMGMQLGKIKGTSLRWLDVKQKLLPASLKELNYTTHAVGKWHLGFCHWNLTPRFRGFDTFYGFFGGALGYFNHSGKDKYAYDFRDNGRVAWENKGLYSTELHTTRVQKIIRTSKRPFFIYMAYQNAHSPFECKKRYEDQYCSHVDDDKRRIHCAMVAAMDESIGNITQTLNETGQLRNTILIYLSDNGGPTGDGSYNWPLRGGKNSFWEGGMRQHTIFVYPKKMKKCLIGTVWDGLMHVTDWYPTLYSAAGGDPTALQTMDGIDQYQVLIKGLQSRRTEMIYNIDPTDQRSAARIGDYKLLLGQPGKVRNAWWAPPDMEKAGTATSITNIDSIPKKQLYNVREDPEEFHNLIEQAQTDCKLMKVLEDLESLLEREEKNVIPFVKPNTTKLGRPKNFGGAWSPGWCTLQ